MSDFPFGILVFTALVHAGLCAWLADEKGRSIGSWLLLGFLFQTPALLALGFSPELSADELASEERSERRVAREPVPPDEAKPWVPGAGPPPDA